MSFRDNLQHLRATRNMTQEQLAMLLGVSRQSVSKWEAEKSYPEMDKLLKLCDLFDCTLDELVKGDLTTREPEPELAVAPNAQPTDVCGYNETMLKTGHRIALGVGVILLAVGASGFLANSPQAIANLPQATGAAFALFGGLAAGLALIIPSAFERSAFQKAHPFIEDFYSPEEKAAAQRRLGYCIVIGIAFILLSLGITAIIANNEQAAPLTFFPLLAIGVTTIVDAGITTGRMNVEEYNDQALAELSDAEINALDDPELAKRARAKKREGGIYGAIMLTATAIALFLLFCGDALGLPGGAHAIFWVPWPIGGITCGIVACIRQAR